MTGNGKMKNILVIGAGLMGSGIAQVAAQAGYKVYLNDISEEYINRGIDGIKDRWDKKVSKGSLSAEERDEYMSCLKGTADYSEVEEGFDLVIEAASEDFNIKKAIFNKVSTVVSDETIIASNTSSISISRLQAEVSCPDRFIGTHYFSPVPVMKLLEIIPGIRTSDETYKKTLEFGETLGKVCITSKDSAGFIVNRLLDPQLNEAIRMLDEGVGTVEDIDKGMRFGLAHPMGPFELLDMAGIDVEYAVMQVLYAETGNPYFAPAPLLRKMVEAGMTGKKAGKGFYVYGEDGSKTVNPVFAR